MKIREINIHNIFIVKIINSCSKFTFLFINGQGILHFLQNCLSFIFSSLIASNSVELFVAARQGSL